MFLFAFQVVSAEEPQGNDVCKKIWHCVQKEGGGEGVR
jgi:hypothetical protein